MMPFVVFSLPRSRSAWLSSLLSYGDEVVGHDYGSNCGTVSEFIEAFENDMIGTCETGSMMGWPLMRRHIPDIKFAVVLRPLHEVLRSLAAFGFSGLAEEMAAREKILNEISALPGTVTLQYRELDSFSGCGRIFEHCRGIPLVDTWWDALRGVNIQVHMPTRLAQLVQNYSRIEALKNEVRAQLACGTEARCPASH